jgi:hypothetical protein
MHELKCIREVKPMETSCSETFIWLQGPEELLDKTIQGERLFQEFDSSMFH